MLSSYITVPVNYGGSNGVCETKMFLVECYEKLLRDCMLI